MLAKEMGISRYSELNLQIGRLSKRIVKKLPNIKYPTLFDELHVTPKIADVPIQYTYIPFEGKDDEDNPDHFYWILRQFENALKKLIATNTIDNDERNVAKISGNQAKCLYERAKKQITVNTYERNRKARNICIRSTAINALPVVSISRRNTE